MMSLFIIIDFKLIEDPQKVIVKPGNFIIVIFIFCINYIYIKIIRNIIIII